MLVVGLQKNTLLDYPGKVSCILFTYGCNMLCGYCHNPGLVTQKLDKNAIMSEEDILSFLRRRVGQLDAVTITGGEPTLHKGLLDLVQKIKELGFLVKLDSNGTFPERLKPFVGVVDYFAMDIKNSPSRYWETSGANVDIEKIKESISIIMDSGSDYEFRTTVVPGLHDSVSFKGIGGLIKGAKNYYIQNFRPGDTVDEAFSNKQGFGQDELASFESLMKSYVDNVGVRVYS